MPIEKTEKIWMNGEFVNWDDATVHVLTHTLHYGNGTFEGIRAYETDRGPAVFQLRPHIERLFQSAKILFIDIPWTVDDLVKGVLDTVRINKVSSCYIRPLVYLGYGEIGLNPLACKVEVSIDHATELLEKVKEVHELFWGVKGRDISWYTAG